MDGYTKRYKYINRYIGRQIHTYINIQRDRYIDRQVDRGIYSQIDNTHINTKVHEENDQ